MRKKEEHKRKIGRKKILTGKYLCVNAYHSFHNTLIENLKCQVAANQKHQVAQLKNLGIKSNQATVEIKRRGIKFQSKTTECTFQKNN